MKGHKGVFLVELDTRLSFIFVEQTLEHPVPFNRAHARERSPTEHDGAGKRVNVTSYIPFSAQVSAPCLLVPTNSNGFPDN